MTHLAFRLDAFRLPAKNKIPDQEREFRSADTQPEIELENLDVGAKLRKSSRGVAQFSKSVRVQLAALLLVFAIPPLLLYSVFATAEVEKQNALLTAVRESGVTIARAIMPLAISTRPGDLARIPDELKRFEIDQRRISVLLKPANSTAGFYYVASVPETTSADMAAERERLASLGVLQKLEGSCTNDAAFDNHIARADGQHDVLLSITPILSPKGCWVVIYAATAQSMAGVINSHPYWTRPEARIAAIIYVTLAILVFVIFATVWMALSRFQKLASAGVPATSFADATTVPELAPMGRAFDLMVDRLKQTTDILRRAAEDNAHAFKGPIAVMRQALELLTRKFSSEGHSYLAVMKTSLDRLEGLALSAQHLDAATADLLSPKWAPMNLSEIVSSFVEEYKFALEINTIQLSATITPGVNIEGRRESIETILENVIDNAVSFSPESTEITVRLMAEDNVATLIISDQGPGVDARKLPYIFNRYYSSRPAQSNADGAKEKSGAPHEMHFGIGLWVVAQNVHALRGTVDAENRPGGGFMVTVKMPAI